MSASILEFLQLIHWCQELYVSECLSCLNYVNLTLMPILAIRKHDPQLVVKTVYITEWRAGFPSEFLKNIARWNLQRMPMNRINFDYQEALERDSDNWPHIICFLLQGPPFFSIPCLFCITQHGYRRKVWYSYSIFGALEYALYFFFFFLLLFFIPHFSIPRHSCITQREYRHGVSIDTLTHFRALE